MNKYIKERAGVNNIDVFLDFPDIVTAFLVLLQGSVLFPHSKKVPGSSPSEGRGLSVGSLHLLPVHAWIPS